MLYLPRFASLASISSKGRCLTTGPVKNAVARSKEQEKIETRSRGLLLNAQKESGKMRVLSASGANWSNLQHRFRNRHNRDVFGRSLEGNTKVPRNALTYDHRNVKNAFLGTGRRTPSYVNLGGRRSRSTGIGAGSYPQAVGASVKKQQDRINKGLMAQHRDIDIMLAQGGEHTQGNLKSVTEMADKNLATQKGLYGEQYNLQKDLIGQSAEAEAAAVQRTEQRTGEVLEGQKKLQPTGYIDQLYGRERPGYEANLQAQRDEIGKIATQTAQSQSQVMDEMVAQGRMDVDEATALKTQEKENFLAQLGQYDQRATNMLQKQLADSLERASAFKEGADQEIENQFLDQLGQLNVAGAKGGFSSPQNAQQTKLLTNRLKASVNVNEKVATLQQAASTAFTQAGLQVLDNVKTGAQTAAQWGMQIANEAMNEKTALGKLSAQSKVTTLGNLGTALTAAANRHRDGVSEWIAKHVADHINYKTHMNTAEMARANLIAGLDRSVVERATERQLNALGKVTDNIAKATEKAGDLKVATLSKYYDDYLKLIESVTRMRLDIRRDATQAFIGAEKDRMEAITGIQQDRRGLRDKAIDFQMSQMPRRYR